jgi:hypothetical protein
MDLVDRYVHAVRFWLPRSQEADIASELSEDLRAEIADRQAALGRPLNTEEMEALLKDRGRPLLVATRYLPQQFLIGPVLFPVYRVVLIIVALGYLVSWLLTWIGLASFSPTYRSHVGLILGGLWSSFWITTLVAFGLVTLLFAVLERLQVPSTLVEWNPRRLPAVRDARRIPRLQSAIAMAVGVCFIVWWAVDMWSTTVFDRAGVRVVLSPAWRGFYWVVLAISLANLALAAVSLFRPYWTMARAGIQTAIDLAGAATFCWLLKLNILAEIATPQLSSSRAAETVATINASFSRAFPVAIALSVIVVAIVDVGRLVRLRK